MFDVFDKLLNESFGLYNCGSALADDSKGKTGEDSYMRIYSEKTKEDFNKLVSLLKNEGYTIKVNKACGNLFADVRGEHAYYVYYTDRINEIRVIENDVSAPLSLIERKHKKKGTTEVYQYRLDHDLEHCGMAYIIKLTDGSLFLIDGGHPNQAPDYELERYYRFMKELTGTPDGKKIRIAGWYISHAHGDHLGVPAYFMKKYHGKINVESFIFNFPSSEYLHADSNTIIFREYISKYFKKAHIVKVHTGEKLKLCSAELEFLYTHEDAVDPFGLSSVVDFNSSSTVLRVTYDGLKVFFPGDIHAESEVRLALLYDKAYLKSEVMQVAHHCYNSLPAFYALVDADYYFIPQAEKYVVGNTQRNKVLGEIRPYAKVVYFGEKESYKIISVNGKAVIENLGDFKKEITE